MARLVLAALLAVSCSPASELPGGQPTSASNPQGKASTRNPARAVPYPRPVLSRPARRADRNHLRTPLHDWSGVAACESSGDWHINTGNGYAGGLQMDAAFWANYGGLRFAPRPDLASRLEQTVVAERGLAVQGIGAWPICGRYIQDGGMTENAPVKPASCAGAGVPSNERTNRMIDVPDVLADLQAIVAEAGDGFLYRPPDDETDECVYIAEGDDGEAIPSCIVGHVLARHGLLLRPYSTCNIALSADREELLDGFYEDFTPAAVRVLAAAQKAQDTQQLTWGEALIAAKEAASGGAS